MPRPRSSVIGVQACEDDTAVILNGKVCVEQLRIRDEVLRRQGKITPGVFRDSQRMCDYIDHALGIGLRNTARLRRIEAGQEMTA